MSAPKPERIADTDRPTSDALGLAYWAWTIIANVSEGNWDEQTEDWVTAAKTWRDAFHAALDAEGIGRDESLAERHQRHYQTCDCLGDKAICCDPECPCHGDHSDGTEGA